MTRRRLHSEPRQFWTPAQDAQLKRLYPHAQTCDVAAAIGRSLEATYRRAAKFGLRKSAAYLASPEAHRFDGLKGIGTRFVKGLVPANKGLRRPGWYSGRMRETQFKKGNVSRRWEPQVYCVGALRVNADGYLEIKVREGSRSWVGMARFCWESERGPIPKSHVIRPVNGDPDDTRIENLICVSRGALLRDNYHDRYPVELRRLVQLRGALNRQINRRQDEKQDRRSA